MKTILHLLFGLLCAIGLEAQITTPQIKAGFGVDAELRSRFFMGAPQSGNDDWYTLPGSVGVGRAVIDTTGAAAIVSRYATDLNFRKLPFYRTMAFPSYDTSTGRTLIDAVFIRDYHGDDSTIFASGASKNGMSPADWSCPVSQSIPDKNDILDMFVHVRREGKSTSTNLWMFGGLSIENNTGDRYFDFEMYQTDIYYDRPSRKFYGYGPDAGHTSWQFNSAGDVLAPGDIIFSAHYGSSTLSDIEARIWVHQSALSITPTGFDWTMSFDGAASGSQYGYAGIKPKTAGAFYTGMECFDNTWVGPFSLVRGDNSLMNVYESGQFMEFSVNLTFLGLDPVTLLGSNACGMPFRRVLVKSRASTSFTAALKDFVGPFDFFLAPRAEAAADFPIFCGFSNNISTIQVTNPMSTSVYTWSTPNGSIVGGNTGTSITVDTAGTYIVTQQLQTGCSTYATDTVNIVYDATCMLLADNLVGFSGVAGSNRLVNLYWDVISNNEIRSFVVERSTDGLHFTAIDKAYSYSAQMKNASYRVADDAGTLNTDIVYYRLRITGANGMVQYSAVVKVNMPKSSIVKISIVPNPVRDVAQLIIMSPSDNTVRVFVYDIAGRLMKNFDTRVQKGKSTIRLEECKNWESGMYSIKVVSGKETLAENMMLVK